MYTTSMWCSRRPGESIEFPGTGLTDGCDLPDLGAKSHSPSTDALKQEALLTAELVLLSPLQKDRVSLWSPCVLLPLL